MNSVLRRTIKIFAIIAAIPIGLILLLLCILLANDAYQLARLPEICKNLPRHIADISPAFDERVQKMYSMPIAEDALIQSLREQKFRFPTYRNPDMPPDVYTAYAEHNFIPCDQSWVIEWRKGADGMAYDIHGRYNAACL